MNELKVLKNAMVEKWKLGTVNSNRYMLSLAQLSVCHYIIQDLKPCLPLGVVPERVLQIIYED